MAVDPFDHDSWLSQHVGKAANDTAGGRNANDNNPLNLIQK